MTVAATETVAPVVKVGDFFESSWGYDQTNVDFYKVVAMTASGKSVKVQKWTKASVPSEHDHFSTEYVVPGEGPALVADWSDVPEGTDYLDQRRYVKYVPAPVETKRLRTGGYFGAGFHVSSYSSAFLWDGKPAYQTASGFGH